MLGTTTSVRDAGLLASILPPFERATGSRVRVVAVGSGQAMVLGRRGEADILILHDPAGEQAFVADGFGVDRAPLMHNEFVLVGPATDPARVRGLRDAASALDRVAARGALFVSRGDRSGTHVREQALWARAGTRPDRAWYRESGQGMSATLQIANQLQAYVLADIGTLMSHRARLDLEIFVQGDSLLHNPYHVILVNSTRFGWVNTEGARALWEYLLSEETQRRIGAFGQRETGRALFHPDAVETGAAGAEGAVGAGDTAAVAVTSVLAVMERLFTAATAATAPTAESALTAGLEDDGGGWHDSLS